MSTIKVKISHVQHDKIHMRLFPRINITVGHKAVSENAVILMTQQGNDEKYQYRSIEGTMSGKYT